MNVSHVAHMGVQSALPIFLHKGMLDQPLGTMDSSSPQLPCGVCFNFGTTVHRVMPNMSVS